MVEVLRIVLGVLVVVSLATIVAYVLVFFAVAAWTVLTGSRRDPLRDDLDRVLAEIVGPRAPLARAPGPAGQLGGEGTERGQHERTGPFARRRPS